ncbi:hypothetical protein NGM10_09815 [Halorussus salilacus]|uniref:hypothetical protein n=1 Tax=Halorussus salilacus TaxID=2953750 RepID=UPI00209D1C45|nr:hypothetical protein [Halorussus salilacus]USZ67025.1 hypothetical protein NGM10_09815 [Halorussus salilacus]
MADPDLLARLDRITILLAALLGVELLELFDVSFSAFGLGLLIVAIAGFWLLWGRSVVGLLLGDSV